MRLRVLLLLLLLVAPPFAVAASTPDLSGIAYEQKPGTQIPCPRYVPRRHRSHGAAVTIFLTESHWSLRSATSIAPIFAASFAPICSMRSARPE